MAKVRKLGSNAGENQLDFISVHKYFTFLSNLSELLLLEDHELNRISYFDQIEQVLNLLGILHDFCKIQANEDDFSSRLTNDPDKFFIQKTSAGQANQTSSPRIAKEDWTRFNKALRFVMLDCAKGTEIKTFEDF